MFVRKIMKDKEKEPKEELPSAVEDCADVTSKHERFKKETDKSKFSPVDYEKPPHY